MSTIAAVGNGEKSKIFDTILSSPGMNEKCRINLLMSRRNILLLSRLIEVALLTDKNVFEDDIVSIMKENSLTEFKSVYEEILTRAQLTDFYERLKSI